ncbi:MAG: DUF5615 family PIN-like protein [Nitrospinae bacterium]|nr:DUF5615 family PIN-like protein [Nitrospinota bacterium]
MKLLVDMNLSPNLVTLLCTAGHEAVHWSSVGDPRVEDSEILIWARANKHIVLTHDLDFGAILAATSTDSPSVLQVRTQNVAPQHIAPIFLSALEQYKDSLEKGAIVTCDEWSVRVRILPIQRD